mgnify:CR=1 FL=1
MLRAPGSNLAHGYVYTGCCRPHPQYRYADYAKSCSRLWPSDHQRPPRKYAPGACERAQNPATLAPPKSDAGPSLSMLALGRPWGETVHTKPWLWQAFLIVSAATARGWCERGACVRCMVFASTERLLRMQCLAQRWLHPRERT